MHKSNGGEMFWNKEKETLIKMYIDGVRIKELAKKYNCNESTIVSWLKRFGVYKRKERCNSKYTLNQHFFDNIETEEQAYILGFVLSDGCVYDGGVGIYSKDKDIIDKIKKCFEYDGKEVCKKGCWILSIYSRYMSNILSEIGIPHNKNKHIDIKKILNNIDEKLVRHFVRGMFDGDGSIKIYKYEYFKTPSVHFGYTGTVETVDFIKSFFNIHTKDAIESEFIKTCRSSCKKDVLNYLEKIYKDATIYMDRKYKTYIELKEICENLQRL